MLRVRALVWVTVTMLGLQATVSGSLITGVSAISDNGASFGTDLANTLNGTGLTWSLPSLSDSHEATIPSNSWIGGTPTGAVTFDLGGLFWLEGFSFWNQNDGGPGAGGTSGINGVLIESSINGTDFVPIAGAPLSFALVAVAGGAGPEVIAFAPVNATHVRFNILSNHGDANTGFAEVHFDGVPTPEPSGWPQLGCATLGLVFLRRRLRR